MGCWGPPRTLAQDLSEARLVLAGTLAGKRAGDGSENWHATQVHIEKVLKSDPWFGDRKVVNLSVPISFYPNNKKFILFCDVSGHQLVPLRGFPIENTGAVEQYVT